MAPNKMLSIAWYKNFKNEIFHILYIVENGKRTDVKFKCDKRRRYF